ncbi:MAG: PilX N-terminal domain-containing pilus assembly protein [Pseudomonadota bacterium]
MSKAPSVFLNPITLRRQRGAALIIGLVLLAVLTLLGITGVVTSSNDLRMMGSAREALNAFEATESALAAAISSNEAIELEDTTAPGDEVRDPVTFDLWQDGVVTSTATTTFTGFSDAVPIGWEQGASVTVHFQVDSATVTSQRGANADNTAGFYIVAPVP